MFAEAGRAMDAASVAALMDVVAMGGWVGGVGLGFEEGLGRGWGWGGLGLEGLG